MTRLGNNRGTAQDCNFIEPIVAVGIAQPHQRFRIVRARVKGAMGEEQAAGTIQVGRGAHAPRGTREAVRRKNGLMSVQSCLPVPAQAPVISDKAKENGLPSGGACRSDDLRTGCREWV